MYGNTATRCSLGGCSSAGSCALQRDAACRVEGNILCSSTWPFSITSPCLTLSLIQLCLLIHRQHCASSSGRRCTFGISHRYSKSQSRTWICCLPNSWVWRHSSVQTRGNSALVKCSFSFGLHTQAEASTFSHPPAAGTVLRGGTFGNGNAAVPLSFILAPRRTLIVRKNTFLLHSSSFS